MPALGCLARSQLYKHTHSVLPALPSCAPAARMHRSSLWFVSHKNDVISSLHTHILKGECTAMQHISQVQVEFELEEEEDFIELWF